MNVIACIFLLLLILGGVIVCSDSAGQSVPKGSSGESSISSVDLGHVNITMLRIGSIFSFPEYYLEVHGDGKVLYRGYKNVAVKKEHVSNISEIDTRKLIDEIMRIRYFYLNQSYTGGPTDAPAVKTAVTIENKSKSVYDYLGSEAPEELRTLYEMIDNTTNSDSWVSKEPIASS